MTIAMPDSVTPGNIPMGYEAYLGYVDGLYQTAPRLPVLFPGAHYIGLTVLGGDLQADGVDCEPGNVDAAGAAQWVQRKLGIHPAVRPVVYASVGGAEGYGMPDVIAELLKLGIARPQYRVLTAHYTGQAHICSPATCRDRNGNPVAFTADGTQWSSSYPGLNGSRIDMSLLDDDFFGTPLNDPAQNWTEKIMQQLPVAKQGMTGDVVRTVQGLCAARGHAVTVDGVFGAVTEQAVRNVQAAAKVIVDGIVGPVTWGALLGV